MRKRHLIAALLLFGGPLFAEQRLASNQASTTLTIHISVRPSLNTPPPIRREPDQGVIFNLAPAPQLKAIRDEVVLPSQTKLDTTKPAVLRTTTYTTE